MKRQVFAMRNDELLIIEFDTRTKEIEKEVSLGNLDQRNVESLLSSLNHLYDSCFVVNKENIH